jgi:outer membrane lipoprotein carrier protein
MTISMKPTRLVTALTLAAAPLLARAQTADAAYEKVAKAWASTKTLDANFEQKITNPVLGKTATSRGRFLQQRPGKVSITFTDPAGDQIVDDGKNLWVYLPSSAPGQVLKLPSDADGAIVADLLGQLLDTPKKAFTISGGESSTIEGKSTKRVQLVPKAAGTVPFTKAVLWLDDATARPVRVQVIDGQGIDRTITLTSWSPDATLPSNAFTFKIPKGAKVSTKLPGQ